MAGPEMPPVRGLASPPPAKDSAPKPVPQQAPEKKAPASPGGDSITLTRPLAGQSKPTQPPVKDPAAKTRTGQNPVPAAKGNKATPEFNEKVRGLVKDAIPDDARTFLRERGGVTFKTPRTLDGLVPNSAKRAVGFYDSDARTMYIPEKVYVEMPDRPGEYMQVDNGSRTDLRSTIGHEAGHAMAGVTRMELPNGTLDAPLKRAFDIDMVTAKGRTDLSAKETSYLNYYRFGTYRPAENQKERMRPGEVLADLINGGMLSGQNNRDYETVKGLFPQMDSRTRREFQNRTGLPINPKTPPKAK